MSFFKKISKGISSITKKAPSTISNIFKKSGDISQGISQGLGKVSDVLGKVGSVVNNPLVQSGASALFGPEAGEGLAKFGAGLSKAKDISRMGSGLAGRAGALSKEASGYKSLADARGGIEKAKELYSDARGVAGPQFA